MWVIQQGSEVDVGVGIMSCVDTIHSSPVASNASYTCTDLSFVQVLDEEDGVLFSYSHVMDLISFSIDEQYLASTSHHMIHDTKVMQYTGSFWNFVIFQTKVRQLITLQIMIQNHFIS